MKKLTYFDFTVSEIKGTKNDVMLFQFEEIIDRKTLIISINHIKILKKFTVSVSYNQEKVEWEDNIINLNLALEKANIFYQKYTNDK